MRRRRGGSAAEFPSSGEDSFVAVVVTKLTGALLFILLLTMVIMALIPRAADLPRPATPPPGTSATRALTITTPAELPEAIVGRPYRVALAAEGGSGPLRWSLGGALPDGLTFDASTAQLHGVARRGTSQPVRLAVSVTDGLSVASRQCALTVFQPTQSFSLARLEGAAVSLRTWAEQGFGFLVLLLVHLVGMSSLARVELSRSLGQPDDRGLRSRFRLYRWAIRLGTLGALASLAAWLAVASGA